MRKINDTRAVIIGTIFGLILLIMNFPALSEEEVKFDLKKLNEPLALPEKKKESARQKCAFLFAIKNFGLNYMANTKDSYLGIFIENQLIQKSIFDINLSASLDFRTFEKTAFEQTGETTYTQYREFRSIIAFKAVEKLWINDAFGFFAGGGPAYTFASYNGSFNRPKSEWAPLYCGGAMLNFGNLVYLGGGYQYVRIPHSPDHYISVFVSLNLIEFFSSIPEEDIKKIEKESKKVTEWERHKPKEIKEK